MPTHRDLPNTHFVKPPRAFGFARALEDEKVDADKKAGMLVRCPHCKAKNRVPRSATAKLLRCGECKRQFRLRGAKSPQKGSHRVSRLFPNTVPGRARATIFLIVMAFAVVVLLGEMSPHTGINKPVSIYQATNGVNPCNYDAQGGGYAKPVSATLLFSEEGDNTYSVMCSDGVLETTGG